jgi:thiamine-phosphate pyrophosphorylase
MQLVTNYCPDKMHTVYAVVEEALSAGCDVIQFSWGNCSDIELLRTAERVTQLVKDYNAKLCVNNNVELAVKMEADSVHLGRADTPLHVARKLIPSAMQIGYTIDSLEQVEHIDTYDADYFGVGAIFGTKTKVHTKPTLGLSGLSLIRAATDKHIVAIGGIRTDNAVDVVYAGADSLAVIGAVYDAKDKHKNIQELLQAEKFSANKQWYCQ